MPSSTKVLGMLREAGERGVSTGEFLDKYVGRHGSAIAELRKLGHHIETIPLDPIHAPRGPARYLLREGAGLGAGNSVATPASPPDPPTSAEPSLFDTDALIARPGYADREAA